MPRHTIIKLAALSLATGLFSAQAQAQAQDTGDERINQLIIYGDDPCPPSTDDQITVCARKEESERYRIPEPLRESDSPQNDAWNNRVLAYETVGKGGTLSCSPVGGGGWTGCVGQMIETAYAEKDSDPSLRFAELIAEERARRLATIDEEAAAQQARVEEAERVYLEQQEQAGSADVQEASAEAEEAAAQE